MYNNRTVSSGDEGAIKPGKSSGPRLRNKAKTRAATTSKSPKPNSRFKDKRFEKASASTLQAKKAKIRR